MRNSQASRRPSTAPLAGPVPHPQENLLHYIVSTRIVADDTAHVIVDLLPIALKELLERAGVAFFYLRYELWVWYLH